MSENKLADLSMDFAVSILKVTDGIIENSRRILYSNDGLIFVSYDHAKTFYELVR